MGFVDNTLQRESTKVVSNSQGRLGRLPMEGQRDARGGLPKYKQRSVSAVRDFPPGCGRHAPRISLEPKEEAVCITIVENLGDLVRNGHAEGDGLFSSRSGIVSQPPKALENLGLAIIPGAGEMNQAESNVEAHLIPSQNGIESQPAKALENTSSSVIPRQSDNLESKLEAPVDPSELGNGNLVKIELVNASFPGVPDSLSNAGDELGNGNPVKIEPVNASFPGVPDSLSNAGDELGNGNPVKIEPVNASFPGVPDSLSNAGDIEELKALEHETDNLPNILHKNDIGSSRDRIFPLKYPPRRKVSAVRDFPPFCGRNAAPLVHGNTNVLASTDGEIPKRHNMRLESEGQTTKHRRNQDKFGAYSKNEIPDSLEQSIKSRQEKVQDHLEFKTKSGLESGKRNIKVSEDIEDLDFASNRPIVLGLATAGSDPHKPMGFSGSRSDIKPKKSLILQEHPKASLKFTKNDFENSGGVRMKEKMKKNSFSVGLEDKCDHVGESDSSEMVRILQNVDVTLPPRPIRRSRGKSDGNDGCVTRSKVKETLRLFHAVYRKIVKEDETKSKNIKRPDCVAGNILKEKGLYINLNKIIGPVPGVEVGDEFQYRIELHIIGLHRPMQGGIDCAKDKRGRLVATSIVASGGYDDNMDDSDVLIYTGSGGNVMNGKKEPEDQKLEKGNLGLKNSADVKNPVRVVRGDMRVSESSSAKTRIYVYDGLYTVDKWWQELGPHSKIIFKFKLVRLPSQPELAWKVLKKCKKFKTREGVCMDDISKGKEIIPICAINTVDEEKPPQFKYITRVIYPNRFIPNPPGGCDCTKECSGNGKCSCVAKNGGLIYNRNGAIVEAKSLVYECGPSCKCPPSCYNKVSQHGIKFQLEIFKTESRGWGVRSLNSISPGSFICEYVGELLEDKEAEERKGNDEYLFDIGTSYTDNSTWDGFSNLLPETHQSSSEMLGESSFTIDAANYGNVGRFINHSCSPNLYAQNVLYDHLDKRVPHIMFFAADNIPPLQELTYDYNYKIDEVHDSDGSIKKKECFCGSSECTGRLY